MLIRGKGCATSKLIVKVHHLLQHRSTHHGALFQPMWLEVKAISEICSDTPLEEYYYDLDGLFWLSGMFWLTLLQYVLLCFVDEWSSIDPLLLASWINFLISLKTRDEVDEPMAWKCVWWECVMIGVTANLIMMSQMSVSLSPGDA